MKPVYAIGGAAALALLMLAGWFIIRSNIQTTGLVEGPQLPAVSISESQTAAQLAVPEEAVSQPDSAQPEMDMAASNEQLVEAVKAGDVVEVKQLLNNGANPDFVAERGDVPLVLAAAAGDLKIVQLLLDAGADVNSTMDGKISAGFTFYEGSSLLQAAAAGHLDVVELLLANDADPNQTEKAFGIAPLHVAAWENYAEIIQALLAHGAEADLRGTRGDTPLEFAALTGSVEAAVALIEAGADVDNRDLEQGWTPLIGTIVYSPERRPEMVDLLLENGADPDLQENFGNTALHYAAFEGNSSLVEALLAGGASPDLQNNGGRTALHRAAAGNRAQVVQILIEHGASLDIRDIEGRTALDIANGDSKDLLREAEAE